MGFLLVTNPLERGFTVYHWSHFKNSNVKENVAFGGVSLFQSPAADRVFNFLNRKMKNQSLHEVGFLLKSLSDSASARRSVFRGRRPQDEWRHHETQHLQRHVSRRRRRAARRRVVRFCSSISSTALVGEVAKEADEVLQDASVEIGQSLTHDLASLFRVRSRGKAIVIKARWNDGLTQLAEPLLQHACQRVDGGRGG